MKPELGRRGAGRPARRRLVLFGLLVAGCTAVAALYVISAVREDEAGDSRGDRAPSRHGLRVGR